MRSFVRLSKEEVYKLNASEKLILFYRNNPVQAAKDLLSTDLAWFQRKTLRDLWFKKYNLLLMSRGIGKTWLLGLFAVLYAMLHPNARIGVIAPSFKQTEFLFDKISGFYEECPYFRASVSKFSKTTYKAICKFHNGSFVEGLPLGTGEKIRGQRYNIILIDEYAFVSEEIVKKVVRPMMNVKRKGVDNKYIISSTAYYTWNHFYLQYLLYNVMTVRKPEMYGLHEYIFEDLKMVSDPPFELDDDVYEMMRMDTTEEMFSMENRCLTDCNTIVCKDNTKNIKDVSVSDKVLSGSGNFEKVLKTSKRFYDGDIVRIKAWKNAHEILEVTPEHPVFIKREDKYEYVEAKEIKITDKIAFRIPNSKEIDFNLKKAYIMGLYLAEGNISKDTRKDKLKKPYKPNRYTHKVQFSIHQKETNLTKKIVDYFSNFDVNVKTIDNKDTLCREIYFYKSSDGNDEFLSGIKDIGRVSYIKKIPSYVFDWNKEARIEFIKGILDGDGYFLVDKKTKHRSVHLDLVSEDTIKKLKYLLSQLDIQSSIQYFKANKETQHDVWRLDINSKYGEKIYEWYGKNKTKRTHFKKRGDIEGKYCWFDLKSIEKISFQGYVYNLEIENDPSYITSVSQVHNCLFPIENVGFFSARLIDSCTPKRTEDIRECPIELFGDRSCFYTMGIDAARVAGGDNFAICLIKVENGIKKHVHTFTLNGSPYQEMIFHIRRLFQEFNIVQINIDAGGGGTTIKDLLMQPYKTLVGDVLAPILDMDDKEMEGREGVPILRMVNFTRPVVNDLYMRLKADMQHKTIQFAIDIRRHSDKEFERAAQEILETKRELLVLQAEGKGNYYQFEVPSQFKKDRATALALSVQAANEYLEGFREEEETDIAEGFWI
jgi:DNA-binding transcriptional regulator WhiA